MSTLTCKYAGCGHGSRETFARIPTAVPTCPKCFKPDGCCSRIRAETVTVAAASSDAQATLAFARDLLLNRLMAGAATDSDTVYEPALVSNIWPVAEFTVSAETGTFRVTVERVGEATAQ